MKIPILSYFSGGGFLDLGFKLSGFDIIWSNEISMEFSKAYNTGLSSVLGKDCQISSNKPIQEIDIKDIKKIVVRNLSENIWGIIGGPPCPDFSIGGKNRGKSGEKGLLTKVYMNHINKLNPSFFLFENVKGLISTKKHRQFFDEMIEFIEHSGYAVDFKLINALDLGIPQDRERIIMFGVQKKIFEEKFKKKYKKNRGWFPWPKNTKYEGAKRKFNWPDLCNLNEIPEKPNDIPDALMVGHYILDQENLAKLQNSKDFFKPRSSKFEEIKEGDTTRKSFKKLHRWKYSPTVAYGNNEVHLHPVEPRRLSVREALRLQTVPDTYYMDSNISLTDKFKIIGNGVPVKLSNEIAKKINMFLNDFN